MSLAGQVAIVTGGASGMGRIMALRLAEQGAQVAIFDMNDAGLVTTAHENSAIHPFKCDVSDWPQVQERVAEVTEKLGPVDRLIHAAALMPGHALVDDSVESVTRLMNINFNGTLHMIKAVLDDMLARDSGTLILFGSVAGEAMVPKMGAYCTSKAAVNVYVETLHYELAHTGLKIHLICPPAVNTPLVDQTMSTDTPGSIIEAKKAGRLADPIKIVDAIDKGVAKGKAVIFPGEARLLYLWHALFPRLWWKVVMKFEK
ncbi:MAG: SDR family oxidoreductase [Pseudomonadales bacterium]